MRQKSSSPETPSERLVRDIRRATRKQYSAEEKIRIVLDGLRGEVSIAVLCRREGIAESLYYSWSKEFLEAGKRQQFCLRLDMRPPQETTLLWLTIAVSMAFGWIIWPLYGAVLWAIVAAMVFAPVHRHLLRSYGQRRNLAAFSTVILIVAVVIVPLTLIGAALFQEATNLYAQIQSGEVNLAALFQRVLGGLPDWISQRLRNSGLSTLGTAQDKLSTSLANSAQILASQVVNISQLTLEFVVSLGVMLYLLFFLLRDGNSLFKLMRDAIPLPTEQKEALFKKFRIVIRATVKGDMLVALLQGSLGGIMFWLLAIPSPLLWTVLMTFFSLLPVVGAGIVWIPVAVYFLATGAIWQGVVLTAFGALVIGLVDNIVRPILVGGDTKMPEYVVLIATLGGIATFGLNGFILGPVIAAMFIAVWEIFAVKQRLLPIDKDNN